jgi:pimeloyl-ACP methyl ester carboxylesterase
MFFPSTYHHFLNLGERKILEPHKGGKIMEQVKSLDGTTISYHRQGSGDPVLLVHGGGPGTAMDWALVTPYLEQRYTVITMDRRGRGTNADYVDYSFDLEAADVAAVARAVGGNVHVVGHSSGARVVLLAATRSSAMRSIVLYEPPLGLHHMPESLFERIVELVSAGKVAAAAEIFMQQVTTPEELELIEQSPIWEDSVKSMKMMLPEAKALLSSPIDPEAVKRIRVPVLLLLGDLTTFPLFLDGLNELERMFSDVRRAIIPEQRHMAIAFAPDILAERVSSFFGSVDSPHV